MIAFILHHRRKLIFLLIAITLWSIWGLTKLRFEFYRAIVLPDNDPAVQANKAMDDHFGGQQSVTFMVEGPDVYKGETLRAVVGLTKDVAGLTGVSSPQDVISLATIQEVLDDKNGFTVRPLTDVEENLQQRFEKSPFYNQFLVSKDHRAALVMATLGERAYPDPSVSSPDFFKAHTSEVKALVAKYSRNGVRVWATGSQLALAEGNQKLKPELFILTSISLLFLLAVFYVSFRSFALTGLASIILVALVWSVGTMGNLGIPLSTSSIYLVIVLVAIGSSYAIHVISTVRLRLEQERSRGLGARAAIFTLSVPLLTVGLTAALGSVSLLTFDTPDIRELGVFQALGITLCYLIAFFILPTATFVLLSRRKSELLKKGSRPSATTLHDRLRSYLMAFVDNVLQKPVQAGLIMLILAVLSVFGVLKVDANFVLEKSVPTHSMPHEGFDRITEKFGHFRAATVVLRKYSPESSESHESGAEAGATTLLSPAGLDEIRKIEKNLKEVPGIHVLPALPEALETVAKYLFKEDHPLTSQDRIDQTMILVGKRKLRRLIDESGTRALINIVMDTEKPRLTAQAVQAVRAKLENVPRGYGAYLGGGPIVIDSMNHYMVINKIESIIMCFIIVFGLCTLVNGSIVLGFVSVFPATLAALMTFGVMGFLGIDLDMSTATITTIAIGVGSDFAVHFLLQFRAELSNLHISRAISAKFTAQQYREVVLKTTRNFGLVIFFDACSNIFGFMSLLFSSFPVLWLAGALLILNQILVIFLTFFCMPLLILIFKPDYPKSSMREIEHALSEGLDSPSP